MRQGASGTISVLGPVRLGRSRLLGPLAANAVVSLVLARGLTRATPALIDDVWQDDAPTATRQALQTLMSRLRAAGLGDALAAVPGGYRLQVAQADVDLLAAGLLAAQAREALGLGQPDAAIAATGEALALFEEPIGGGASNPDLVAELAERATRLESQLLLTRAEGQLALGAGAHVLSELESSGLAASNDDRFVAAHLRALIATGRLTEALDRYAGHRAWLRNELGADPSAELSQLNAATLRQLEAESSDGGALAAVPGGSDGARQATAPIATTVIAAPRSLDPATEIAGATLPRDTQPRETQPRTGVRVGLPASTTELVGRERDLSELAALLNAGRLVSIVGIGGLGKTRLAYALARRFDGPVAVVELAGVRAAGDVELAAASVIGEFGIVPDGERGRAPVDAMARALEGSRALVVFDNCEHVLAAAGALVAVLLARVPQLTVLTTSRSPLGLAGEQTFPLAALASQTSQGEPGPAVALFIERARAVRPAAVLDPYAVARLTARLDGLPLAIELAAARVRSMSVDEIDRRLADRFALLTLGDPTAPARHQTLRAVIDWSWDLLTPGQVRLARRLSGFASSFDAASAAVLAAMPDGGAPAALDQAHSLSHPADLDPLAVLDDLDALVGQSLVQVFEHADSGTLRYRMVETVKDYCAERAREAGEDEAVRVGLALWARGVARRVVETMVAPVPGEEPVAVRADEENLLVALRQALATSDVATAAAVFGALGTWLSLQGAMFELHELGYQVLDLLASRLPEGQEAEATLSLGLLGFVESMAGGARSEQIRELLRTLLAGPGWIPPAVRFVGELVVAGADPKATVRLGVTALSHSDASVRCIAHVLYSSVEENAGRVERAIELGRAAHTIAADNGLTWLRAVSAQILAGLYSELGDSSAAQRWIGEARRDLTLLGQRAANLDITQIEVFGALHDGQIVRARELMRDWRRAPGASRADNILMMELTEAEIDLAVGLNEEALTRIDRALAQQPAGMESASPWWLIAHSAQLAALLRTGQGQGPAAEAVARDLARDLAAVGPAVGNPMRADHPVVGTVAAAMGAWLAATRPTDPSGPELLVLAERMSSRQDIPSLMRARLWETIDPGRRPAAEASVAALPPSAWLDRVLTLVGAIEARR